MITRSIGVILIFAVFGVIGTAAWWIDGDTVEHIVGPEWSGPAPLLVAIAAGLCAIFFSGLLLGVGRRSGPRTVFVTQPAAPVYAAPPAAHPAQDDVLDRLAKAKGMLDAGIIDAAEFDQLKATLLRGG